MNLKVKHHTMPTTIGDYNYISLAYSHSIPLKVFDTVLMYGGEYKWKGYTITRET